MRPTDAYPIINPRYSGASTWTTTRPPDDSTRRPQLTNAIQLAPFRPPPCNPAQQPLTMYFGVRLQPPDDPSKTEQGEPDSGNNPGATEIVGDTRYSNLGQGTTPFSSETQEKYTTTECKTTQNVQKEKQEHEPPVHDNNPQTEKLNYEVYGRDHDQRPSCGARCVSDDDTDSEPLDDYQDSAPAISQAPPELETAPRQRAQESEFSIYKFSELQEMAAYNTKSKRSSTVAKVADSKLRSGAISTRLSRKASAEPTALEELSKSETEAIISPETPAQQSLTFTETQTMVLCIESQSGGSPLGLTTAITETVAPLETPLHSELSPPPSLPKTKAKPNGAKSKQFAPKSKLTSRTNLEKEAMKCKEENKTVVDDDPDLQKTVPELKTPPIKNRPSAESSTSVKPSPSINPNGETVVHETNHEQPVLISPQEVCGIVSELGKSIGSGRAKRKSALGVKNLLVISGGAKEEIVNNINESEPGSKLSTPNINKGVHGESPSSMQGEVSEELRPAAVVIGMDAGRPRYRKRSCDLNAESQGAAREQPPKKGAKGRNTCYLV